MLKKRSVNEISGKLYKLVKEDGLAELEGWNRCSQQLISVARVKLFYKKNSLNRFFLIFFF